MELSGVPVTGWTVRNTGGLAPPLLTVGEHLVSSYNVSPFRPVDKFVIVSTPSSDFSSAPLADSTVFLQWELSTAETVVV